MDNNIPPAVPSKSLVSGRLLVRNVFWNLFGLASPILVAFFTIPLLISGLGKERFGLLTILWMGIGYFSLFDMGLGRAITKSVAERLGRGRLDDLGSLLWTALFLVSIMGLLGAALVAGVADRLVYDVLNVPVELQTEAVTSFQLLAAGIPLVVVTSALIGILEAHQRFATITAIRMPLGILMFVGPLVTLQFSTSLIWATVLLLGARVIAFFAFYIACAVAREELRDPHWPSREHVKPLFCFGGWVSVSNVVGPLMVYFDRFFIGAVMTMTAVAYYVTPYEIVSRAQVLPQSIMAVMFPALATSLGGDRATLLRLYGHSVRILVVLMLPISAGLLLLAPEALSLWLGPDFRDASTSVMQWLAVGLIVNTLARPALTVLQGCGRPDLVAKAHLVELLPYAVLLVWLTSMFGIAGAAAAWTLRALVDALFLNELARRELKELRPTVIRTYGVLAVIAIGAGLSMLLVSIHGRMFALVLVVGVSATLGWPLFKELYPAASRTTNPKAVAR
jgi:O-antigen/teichoic acid export membrane protein